MGTKTAVLKNSSMGLINQVVVLFSRFFIRTLFIRHLGVGILGLNSTFASVLSALSLAELGFGTAVTYSLYKPLAENNYEELNDVMNIFKTFYRAVGIFFTASSVAILPFLHLILKGMEVTPSVYFYFILQSSASTFSYFLAYKRTLLYAAQREYISKTIDLVVMLICSALQCIALVVMESYIWYLLFAIMQTVISNTIVHIYCRRAYPYLKSAKINKAKRKELWNNVKNVFAGKIAGFIYSSTDNIVISTFVSTVMVGFLANYTTVLQGIKILVQSILTPIVPIIGRYMIDEESGEKKEKSFLLYTHIRYLMALGVVIPMIILLDDFITIWVGEDMILSKIIALLLAADLYIHLVHSATCDFINATGLFKQDKYIEMVGAVINITFSIILVQFMGMSGVLVGTVISQMIFWIGRSILVYRRCFEQDKNQCAKYWFRMAVYFAFFIVLSLLCNKVYLLVAISNLIIKILVGGTLCEVIIFAGAFIAFYKMSEHRRILKMAKSFFTF